MNADSYPAAVEPVDIDPPTLLKLTGFNQTALTPGSNGNLWTYAGVGLAIFEFNVAPLIGIDPLKTLLPLTLGLIIADRFLVNGAGFETIYRALFPQYRTKVIRHEAAHFLVAYLLGCPIESCILSAWDAISEPRFDGQAGTVFFDRVLGDQASDRTLMPTNNNFTYF